jgi:hypothetical protein
MLLSEEMDDDERQEILARAYQAIESADQTNARLEERAARRQAAGADLEEWQAADGERLARPYARENEFPAAHIAPAPFARQRAPEAIFAAPRDWAAEEQWVRRLAADVAREREQTLCEGLGEAVGRLLKQERQARKQAIDELRSETKALVASALLEVRAAVAGSNSDITGALDRHIAKIDSLIERLEHSTDAALAVGLASVRLLPN